MNDTKLRHRSTYSTGNAASSKSEIAAKDAEVDFVPSPSSATHSATHSSSRGRRGSDTTSHSSATNTPSTTTSSSPEDSNSEKSVHSQHTKKSGLSANMASILPRVASNNGHGGYKRVDGGRDSGRVGFGWKKFAIGAVVVIGLVWVFGPRERRESVLSSVAPACEWSFHSERLWNAD